MDLRLVGDEADDVTDDDDDVVGDGIPERAPEEMTPKLERAIAAARAPYLADARSGPYLAVGEKIASAARARRDQQAAEAAAKADTPPVPKPAPPPRPAEPEPSMPDPGTRQPEPRALRTVKSPPRVRRPKKKAPAKEAAAKKAAPKKATTPTPKTIPSTTIEPAVPDMTMDQAVALLYGYTICDGGGWVEWIYPDDEFWWAEIGCDHYTWRGISRNLTDPGVAVQRALTLMQERHQEMARGEWHPPVIIEVDDDEAEVDAQP